MSGYNSEHTFMTPLEQNVRIIIQELGPLGAFEKLIADNDALILCDRLDIGRKIVSERTAIYIELTRHWAEQQHALLAYDKPFAVVALGGTGRGEMTPYSDTDFAFLFDGALEGNSFLLKLQKQILHSDAFQKKFGFACEALPFSLDDIPSLEGKQLNSFLDMRPVYDPDGLTQVFLERIRASYNPFDHFLHVREFWQGQWKGASQRSEDFDHFDIKNDGLRVFLAGIWTLAGKEFVHSHTIYKELKDWRDLDAYEFLLRIRAFLHSRRSGQRRPGAGGNHPEDIMTFDDFVSFGSLLGKDAILAAQFEFGNKVRAMLFAARRRIAIFSQSVIRHELKSQREVSKISPIVYGLGGLCMNVDLTTGEPAEKSRHALSLLLASQRYNTSIDPVELQNAFWDAGDWLQLTPELAGIFYEEKGSLASTFEFLSQVVGAEERLFPGYGKFESSLDGRIMVERRSLRGKLQREKIRALEGFIETGRALLEKATSSSQLLSFNEDVNIPVEAALLDSDFIAAIKLALKTKRLPLTEQDHLKLYDESYPLHERFASGFSGISLDDYYQPFSADGGFSEHTIRIVKFLIANRSALMRFTLSGLNDAKKVNEFSSLCGDEDHLRALFVFTCADRVEWESESSQPTRWFNIKELYSKALKGFRPGVDPSRELTAAGYAEDELAVLKDFGQDFFGGMYRRYANRFGPHLLRLAQDTQFNDCKSTLLRAGASTILGIAARDVRGLAATITGLLWQNGVRLTQAHLFSSSNHNLAIDFFHIEPMGKSFPENMARIIEKRVNEGLVVEEAVGVSPPKLKGGVSLVEWRPGQYSLKYEGNEDRDGLIFSLTFGIFKYLNANIFGLTAYKTRRGVFASVYLNLPETISFEEARQLVENHF
ncbi:MAG: hypothetical protein O3C43_07425 [Verrucomicrobia bacterium]|nr:hypothetical protein [Verrucomicrobiota bacterium]